MSLTCWACTHKMSSSSDNIYRDIYYRNTPSPVPLLVKTSPSSPAESDVESSPIRRCSSLYSPSLNVSRQDDNLLHPHDARITNFCNKQDKHAQRDLSCSSLSSMTHIQDVALLTAQQSAAAAAAEGILSSTPGSSKARQKKFHRHFKQVDPDERVLDYFSCALVADILLQGHLYITKNYFAFYSNVFGYTTKLLIPTALVLSVTKEKTAYIIPNAVGVTTEDEKHVFGSLLSRESTYKLMVQVWSTAITALPLCYIPLPPNKVEDSISGDERKNEEEESSLSGSESFLETKTSANQEMPTLMVSETDEPKPQRDVLKPYSRVYAQMYSYLSSLPTSTILLIISTILVILLFLSASVLIYRISKIQSSYSQEHLFNSRSFGEVQDFLSDNIDQLYKVRQSLEMLSLLIETEDEAWSHRKNKLISTKIIDPETKQKVQHSHDS